MSVYKCMMISMIYILLAVVIPKSIFAISLRDYFNDLIGLTPFQILWCRLLRNLKRNKAHRVFLYWLPRHASFCAEYLLKSLAKWFITNHFYHPIYFIICILLTILNKLSIMFKGSYYSSRFKEDKNGL